MQNDLIARLKQLQIVSHGEVELSHAGTSQFYFDFKKAYGDRDAFDLITKRLGYMIPNQTTCIAASGYGGLPLAAGLSVLYRRNLVLVRDKPKDHGVIKIIEGYMPDKEDKVAIVDDVFTTGRTLQSIFQTIEPTGAEIVGCYVLLKRGEGQLPVQVESLLRVEDLL